MRWHLTLIAPRTRTDRAPNSSFSRALTRSARVRSGSRLSRALHPPRRHFELKADRALLGRRHLQVEGLPHQRPRPAQDNDARGRRVHPPFSLARAAQRLPPHPPLRPVRRHGPSPQHRARPPSARRAQGLAPERERRGRQRGRRRFVSPPMPMLWRPDDRRRNVRGPAPRTLPTAKPDQDRHLMTVAAHPASQTRSRSLPTARRSRRPTSSRPNSIVIIVSAAKIARHRPPRRHARAVRDPQIPIARARPSRAPSCPRFPPWEGFERRPQTAHDRPPRGRRPKPFTIPFTLHDRPPRGRRPNPCTLKGPPRAPPETLHHTLLPARPPAKGPASETLHPQGAGVRGVRNPSPYPSPCTTVRQGAGVRNPSPSRGRRPKPFTLKRRPQTAHDRPPRGRRPKPFTLTPAPDRARPSAKGPASETLHSPKETFPCPIQWAPSNGQRRHVCFGMQSPSRAERANDLGRVRGRAASSFPIADGFHALPASVSKTCLVLFD